MRSTVTVGSTIYKNYARSLKLWNSYTDCVCLINIAKKIYRLKRLSNLFTGQISNNNSGLFHVNH